jgi:hypothetical protein
MVNFSGIRDFSPGLHETITNIAMPANRISFDFNIGLLVFGFITIELG